MDEISEPLGGDFENEGNLPEDAIIFRHIPSDQIKKDGSAPASQFVPRPPDKPPGLSLNWDKYSSQESTLIQVGLQYHPAKKPEFKDPSRFTVFQASHSQIKSELLDGFSLVHSPRFSSNPPPMGSPNNRSHSDLDSDEEVRLKLQGIFKRVTPEPNLSVVVAKIEEIKTEWKNRLETSSSASHPLDSTDKTEE